MCRDTPGKARLAVIRIKEELADAKADVIERTREVQARLLSHYSLQVTKRS